VLLRILGSVAGMQMRDPMEIRREKIDDLLEERLKLLAEVEYIEKQLEECGVKFRKRDITS